MKHITNIPLRYRHRFKKYVKSLGIKNLSVPVNGFYRTDFPSVDANSIYRKVICYSDDYLDEESSNILVHTILKYSSLDSAYNEKLK